jgi:plasmid stabilization system protein ParE
LPAAADDLGEIHAFLWARSPDLAHRIVNEIYDAVAALSRTPYVGRPDEQRNTRDLILPRIRYKITYRIKNETLEIIYIRHSSRGPRVN